MKTSGNSLSNFKLLLIAMLSVVFVSFSFAQPKVDQITNMKNYINKSGKEPMQYVISKFADNDIVMINQFNCFKHEVDFMSSLIPELQKNGIHILAMEYGNTSDQEAVDKIINAVNFDEEAVKEIMSNYQEYGINGYQEYLNLFKAAWNTNRFLAKNEKKFRIFLLNSPGINLTERTRLTPSIIYKEIISKGEKAVIYCTAINSPNNRGEYSCLIQNGLSSILDQKKKKVFSINIHSPWIVPDKSGNRKFELTKPMNGIIDEAISKNGNKPIGFDIKGSPFENLMVETAYYKNKNNKNCSFKDICDGYIFLTPYEEYETLTWIPDFINNINLAKAKKYYSGINSELQIDNVVYANDLCESLNASIVMMAKTLQKSQPLTLIDINK